MPDPIVRSGMHSSQAPTPVPTGIVFPRAGEREPGAGADDLIFESFADYLRIQLNSPEVAVNLVTGTKTKARNEVIQFVNGVFIPKGETKERDTKAILGMKGFGAPFKASVWLRSDRQKLEVGKAIAALTDQLRDRPDLISMVSKRLKELAGAGKNFTMPPPPEDGEKTPSLPADAPAL